MYRGKACRDEERKLSIFVPSFEPPTTNNVTPYPKMETTASVDNGVLRLAIIENLGAIS